MKNRESLARLLAMKQRGEKIACLTAYDAGFARILEEEGVDMVLVGDSLGMVLHGDSDTLRVTMEDMVYHTRLVRKGVTNTLLAADMPYNSYLDAAQALKNAHRLLEAGAGMVKLEGGREVIDQVKALCSEGVAVCAHLGLQPQSVHKYGGYKVQGRKPEDADRIFEDARMLEQAGVQMILLECVPRRLAERITAAVSVPTIGIGAGAGCDAQILVLYDVIGVSVYIPKMANDFLKNAGNIRSAVRQYIKAVKSGAFPSSEQSFD